MRFVLLFLVVFFAGCGPDVRLPLKETRELVVLTRNGLTTYNKTEQKKIAGFDHDIVQMFAQELGIKCRFVVVANDAEILRRLKNGDAHFAAAWLLPGNEPEIRSSTPYFKSQNVLVTHEASLPLNDIGQLAGRTVQVVEGSRQEAALRAVQDQVPGLKIGTDHNNEIDILKGVANQRFEAALVNNAEFSIGINFFPELQDAMRVGPEKPIAWLFAPGVDPELVAKADAFLERIQSNGDLAALRDRYFGHINRLDQEDRGKFIERMHTVLPKYRPLFHAAQVSTGIDWRLLAALSYQESHWDPLATSATGVRGMMMLTEDTADQLKVKNRLDPVESIRAGSEYLDSLRNALPPSVKEPDRLWFALAAYNLGMGHLNGARFIAKTLNADPDSWYEMKKVLPLLSKPQYYSRLKSGKGRGGEAVILTENIRIFYDILKRYQPAYRPLDMKQGELARISKASWKAAGSIQ